MDGMDLDQIQMLSLKDLQGFHQGARFMRHFEDDENSIFAVMESFPLPQL